MIPPTELTRLLRDGLTILQRKQARILAYHSISGTSADSWTLSPQQLDMHLAFLHGRGLKVCSLPEIVSRIETGQDVSGRVALTFDDGLADFRTEALPILEKWQTPATVFVVTGKVGRYSDWNRSAPHCPLMTLQDLVSLKSAQVEITLGSHTVSHSHLSQLSMEQLRNEVSLSRYYLEETLMVSDFHFAYPYGDCTAREYRVVKESGYRSAVLFTGIWGNSIHTDRWLLAREGMEARHTVQDLAAILNGQHGWKEFWSRVNYKLWRNVSWALNLRSRK